MVRICAWRRGRSGGGQGEGGWSGGRLIPGRLANADGHTTCFTRRNLDDNPGNIISKAARAATSRRGRGGKRSPLLGVRQGGGGSIYFKLREKVSPRRDSRAWAWTEILRERRRLALGDASSATSRRAFCFTRPRCPRGICFIVRQEFLVQGLFSGWLDASTFVASDLSRKRGRLRSQTIMLMLAAFLSPQLRLHVISDTLRTPDAASWHFCFVIKTN